MARYERNADKRLTMSWSLFVRNKNSPYSERKVHAMMKIEINDTFQLILLKEALAWLSKEKDYSIHILEKNANKPRSEDEEREIRGNLYILRSERELIDDLLEQVEHNFKIYNGEIKEES